LRRRSGGVIDRRGQAYSGTSGLGGLGGMRLPVGGGIGVVLILVVVFAFQLCSSGGFGIPADPLDDLGSAGAAPNATGPAPQDDPGQFVDAVVDDLQIMWEQDIFAPSGRQYELTSVVLFTERTDSGCGAASAAVGPFYCPADGLVYLDLGFFDELDRRFGAPGDYAQAYVIAHEVGHHVQTLLGTNAAVQRESREDPGIANELSVRLELQADCFAGVWAASLAARGGILEPGDLEEGMAAAAAVGDDRIQQQTQGRLDPESFTHGTSEQRVTWLRRGIESGDPAACDTFNEDI
jgi:predicted metalloprotease